MLETAAIVGFVMGGGAGWALGGMLKGGVISQLLITWAGAGLGSIAFAAIALFQGST